MKSTENAFEKARHAADQAAATAQEKNQAWWEGLPMTYQDWEDPERKLTTQAHFQEARRQLLEGNPWLRDHYDFSAMKGKRVLEIGCGSGAATCLFAEAGADVTAVDITAQAVQMTRAAARAFGVTLQCDQMDAEQLSFPADTFDHAFSWGVLHHSQNPDAAFREVARVLKPGGTVLLMVYNRRSLRYWVRGLQWLLTKKKILEGHSMNSVQRFFTDGYYHRHYSPAELRRKLSACGLTVSETIVTHMGKQMVPMIPVSLDESLKSGLGWLLVVRAVKS